MKLAIMQPYLFPYIGYFQLINAVDKFVILDDVNFIMKGWINRNRILVNGKEHLFSVPLKKASQNKAIYSIELAEGNWREKFLKTIDMSYRKAPFFRDCYNLLDELIKLPNNNLSQWLTYQIRNICNYLEIKTTIAGSSSVYCNNQLKGQTRIIDICRQENAETYFNAIGGRALYQEGDFKKQNIGLHFINTLEIRYKQFDNEFISFLSIIDMMMFNDKQHIKKMLTNYILL